MRGNKYRVWDLKGKCWVSCNVVVDYSGLLFWSFGYESKLIDDPETYDVQYFTGLKDKAGKEIYEGDILGMLHARVSNKVYWKVGWTDSRFDLPVGFIWGAFGMRSNIPQYIHPSVNDLEIIGNIHENPELLS